MLIAAFFPFWYIRTMKSIDLISEQQEFLRKLELTGKSFNTIKNYRTDLNCFNKFFTQKGRDLKITQLTTIQVKEYCAHLEQIYNSPNSIRRRVQALRIFYDFLLEKGLNPEIKMVDYTAGYFYKSQV